MLTVRVVSDPSTLKDLADWATLIAAVAAAVIAPLVSLRIGGKQVRASLAQVQASLKVAQQQREDNERAAEQQFHANETALQKQITATVVSNNRQGWINSLREDISEYIAVHESASRIKEISSQQIITTEQKNEAEQLSDKRKMLLTRIRLRLNPEEDLHQYLMKSLTELKDTQYAHTDNKCEEVISVADKILKEEWKRVKSGE